MVARKERGGLKEDFQIREEGKNNGKEKKTNMGPRRSPDSRKLGARPGENTLVQATGDDQRAIKDAC